MYTTINKEIIVKVILNCLQSTIVIDDMVSFLSAS